MNNLIFGLAFIFFGLLIIYYRALQNLTRYMKKFFPDQWQKFNQPSIPPTYHSAKKLFQEIRADKSFNDGKLSFLHGKAEKLLHLAVMVAWILAVMILISIIMTFQQTLS